MDVNYSNWTSIVSDEVLEEKIRQKIFEIGQVFQSKEIDDNLNFCGGAAGHLLFYCYYIQFTKDNLFESKINECLQKIFSEVNAAYGCTFASGLSGISWSLFHLQSNGYIAIPSEIFSVLNALSKKHLDNLIKGKNIDYLHGSTGIILNLLDANDVPEQKLKEWITQLESTGEEASSKSMKWNVLVNYEENEYGNCLGLAHGVPSTVFVILSYLHKYNDTRARELLIKAVNYILESKNPIDSKSLFPNVIINGEKRNPSRLGWCYGDLGCAWVLLKAAKYLNSAELEQEAISIMFHSSKRLNPDENMVFDAGFCHGSVGIAHIFARFYQNTGIEHFKKTSEFWYEKTIEMAIFKDGLAGYKQLYGENNYQNSYTMLEGIAGIGLSLISAISDINPRWDRSLLLC